MSIHLRNAIEKLKTYYIDALIKSGFNDFSEAELKALTITDLKHIHKRSSKWTVKDGK